MGICLDTESNQAVQEQEDSKGGGGEPARRSAIRSSQSVNGNMQNLGKVKFDPPKVPVIFVLGGPGSGKITHCDTLMQEKRGVTHINMMDLLQQYAIGNDMQDFSQLPSKTVTEVLMLEMKMSPAAKTYLVSGYPRSMRDVVEYSEKIQVINGVILISWRQAVLQKQIDYGAKLGHVVLSLAKMELDNFFRNVMPVADYFDQSDMLIAVNGERAPSEVYKDFRAAVLDILGAQENQEALLNGVAGIGRGVDDIPGSIVSVETAPKKPTPPVRQPPRVINNQPKPNSVQIEKIHDKPIQKTMSVMKNSALNSNLFRIPHVIFVIGGPGSNKAVLCLKAVGMNPGWGHFSVGRLLRAIADSEPKPGTENFAVKEALTAGEMVSKSSLDKLIETNLLQLMDKKGIIIDGYPRDMKQVMDFEDKYNQKPPTILLDCSKLQLGRGRLDDTVSSFRRRLELFRELTLPMLKTLDNAGRLTIIDGDTDSVSVQREFEKVVRQHIQNFGNSSSSNDYDHDDNMTAIGSLYKQEERNTRSNPKYQDTTITDLEDEGMPGAIPTISHHVSMSNGQLGGPAALRQLKMKNAAQNGHIPNGRPNFRNVLEDAEGFPIDSHI